MKTADFISTAASPSDSYKSRFPPVSAGLPSGLRKAQEYPRGFSTHSVVKFPAAARCACATPSSDEILRGVRDRRQALPQVLECWPLPPLRKSHVVSAAVRLASRCGFPSSRSCESCRGSSLARRYSSLLKLAWTCLLSCTKTTVISKEIK